MAQKIKGQRLENGELQLFHDVDAIHGSVTVSDLGNDVLELLNKDSSDTLVGTLPYKIEQSGLYLTANTNTFVTISAEDSQLLDLESGEITISKAKNGGSADTYNKVNLSVVSANCINIESADGSTNMSAYINMPKNTLVAGETYTIFGKIEKNVDTGKIKSAYIRLLNASVQLNLDNSYKPKSFVANENGTWGTTYAGVVKESGTAAGDNYNIYLYLYQGELSEFPTGETTLELLANEKYSADGYIGKTATGNDSSVPVYVYKFNQDEGATDNGGVIFFGDSILDFSKVPSLYAEKTGKPIIDCAVGGTRLSGSRDSSDAYYPYDMANIADAIASGDFSAQISGGKNNQFSTLASSNINNYKAIVLEYGTNDFTAGVPFEGATVDTITGALKYILRIILRKYPNMRVVVLSTLQYVTAGSGSESGVPTHTDGTVWEMNEAIQAVCESDEFCVPWVDMYHAFGENSITRGTLTSDGVHLMLPNGAKRYADILVGKLNALGI